MLRPSILIATLLAAMAVQGTIIHHPSEQLIIQTGIDAVAGGDLGLVAVRDDSSFRCELPE